MFLLHITVEHSSVFAAFRESTPGAKHILEAYLGQPGHGAQLQAQRAFGDRWVPPDVDTTPDSLLDEQCPLSKVLATTQVGVEQLIADIERFAASELIEYQSVDRSGHLRRADVRKLDYVASIRKFPDGYVSIDEIRTPQTPIDELPGQVQSVGTPGLILVFHPRYRDDFTISCEGLGEWQGHPAWEVRFEQRTDRVNHMAALVVGGKSYNVLFRGRAWILADSYHVPRVETDLVQEIPQIRLRIWHEIVEYAPVHFQSAENIWLPLSTEIYMDFRGHRFYRRDSFSHFKLFSVTTHQAFAAPH